MSKLGDRYDDGLRRAASVASNCYYTAGLSVQRAVQSAADECEVDIVKLTEYLIACGFGRVADGAGA